MHHQVKGMLVVIALPPDLLDAGKQLLLGE
jgi:hypothetical protein